MKLFNVYIKTIHVQWMLEDNDVFRWFSSLLMEKRPELEISKMIQETPDVSILDIIHTMAK